MISNDYDVLYNLCKYIKLAFEKRNTLILWRFIQSVTFLRNTEYDKLSTFSTLSILSTSYEYFCIFFHVYCVNVVML